MALERSGIPFSADEPPAQPRVPFPEEVSDEDLARHFALSEDDLARIHECRGDYNRVGFALQLCHVRWKGRFATSFGSACTAAIKHVAEQLGYAGLLPLLAYPQRERTRQEHNEVIRQHLGLRAWRSADGEIVRDALVAQALAQRVPDRDMLGLAENILRGMKVLLPGESILRQATRRAIGRIEDVAVDLVSQRIDDELGTRLDGVVEVAKEESESTLQVLKRYPGRAYPKTVRTLGDRIKTLRELGIEQIDLSGIEEERILDFADRVRGYYASPIARFRAAKRRALLACFLSETLKEATDGSVRISSRVLQRLENKAKKEVKQECREFRATAKCVARDWVTVGTVITKPESRQQTIEDSILTEMPTPKVEESIGRAKWILRTDKTEVNAKLVTKHASIQKFMPTFFESVELYPREGAEELTEAVEAVRNAHREHRQELPDDIPTSRRVVPRSWRPFVIRPEGGVHKGPYEVCLAFAIKEAIAKGQVFVKGSRTYVPMSSLVYSDTEWSERRVKEHQRLAADPDELLEGLREQHARAAIETDEGFPDNPFICIENGRAKFAKEPAEQESSELKKLQRAMAAALPPTCVEDLMDWVDRQTGVTDIFEPPPGYNIRMPPGVRRRATNAGILALGTGLGLWVMGQMARGLTYSQLAHVAEWALTEVLLSAANDHLVNLHHALPFARVYGDGKLSSSDGIRFRVRVPKLLSEPSPKYFGWGEGLTSYKAMSDQWSIFSTQLIACHESEALRMLEGLLSNRTTLPLGGGHATDRAAASYAAFALCHLTGFPFWPDLPKARKLKLFRFDKSLDLTHIGCLFGRTIKVDKIRREWDNILRVVASLRDGLAPAHIIGRCLSASVRNDPTAEAINELGMIYATIYYLQAIHLPTLRSTRRRLSFRHESQNQLGRVIVLGAQGELRAPDRRVAAATLHAHTLVQTEVLYYNTWHYPEILPKLQAKGIDVRPELLAQVSPLMYRHINFRGSYDFTER